LPAFRSPLRWLRPDSPRALLRVAWVSPERAGSTSPNLRAFRTGLREVGYVEGKNLVIDTWWGEGSSERLEQMAGDIVRARPEVIVTGSGAAVLPMMRAGVKLPIVFVLSADPVEAKVVASFARPGGNLTGMSLFSIYLMGKRLELLKEAMPGRKRIAIIANPEHGGQPLELKAAQEARRVSHFPTATSRCGAKATLSRRLRTSPVGVTRRSWRSPTGSP
jgi:putative tryptophan/tyrosine transport system substrate-binding protein